MALFSDHRLAAALKRLIYYLRRRIRILKNGFTVLRQFSWRQLCLIKNFTSFLGAWSCSILRRAALRCAGYARPPFMLRVQGRKRCVPTTEPFWEESKLGPPTKEACRQDNTEGKQTARSALYLWPDRLRWHFHLMALWLTLAIGFAGTTTHGWDWRMLLTAVFLFLFLSCVLPYLVYRIFRAPVLDYLWDEWPPFLNCWFQGIAQLGPGSSRTKWYDNLRAYLPWPQWDAVYWSPRGSPQETMLRAAIQDMYGNAGNMPTITIWHERAFHRFLAYVGRVHCVIDAPSSRGILRCCLPALW